MKKNIKKFESFTNFNLIITKCDKNLLQSRTIITECDKNLLKSRIIITK